MDTVTHIVLGACIGEAIAGKHLGKKALFIGALAQSLPDIDFITSFWMGTAENLLAHRGLTHSFLFLLVITPLLAWLSGKIFRNAGMYMGHWSLLWGPRYSSIYSLMRSMLMAQVGLSHSAIIAFLSILCLWQTHCSLYGRQSGSQFYSYYIEITASEKYGLIWH